MPGGIGPVSEKTICACSRRNRTIETVKNSNEIFYNLDSQRVCYDSTEMQLYFVDAPNDPVMRTVVAALAGMRTEVTIEQLHLDAHRFFNAARRLRLTGPQADTVLSALRLSGVGVTVL